MYNHVHTAFSYNAFKPYIIVLKVTSKNIHQNQLYPFFLLYEESIWNKIDTVNLHFYQLYFRSIVMCASISIFADNLESRTNTLPSLTLKKSTSLAVIETFVARSLRINHATRSFQEWKKYYLQTFTKFNDVLVTLLH